jgi:hypothetical protein
MALPPDLIACLGSDDEPAPDDYREVTLTLTVRISASETVTDQAVADMIDGRLDERPGLSNDWGHWQVGGVQITGPGPGVFTYAQVSAALNDGVGLIGGLLNPDGVETGDTIRDASILDLAVNVTAHLLGNPGATLDEAIAACYTNVRPRFDDLGQHWNQHANDIGDYCGNSGKPVPADYDDGTDDPRCPAGCRASVPEDDDQPQTGSAAWNAAVAATVKAWFGRPPGGGGTACGTAAPGQRHSPPKRTEHPR